MSEEEELESSSSIMFSPVYVKLHTQCRCGDVNAFNELQRMSEENDNLAKGFLSLVYNDSFGVVIPYSRYEAKRLMEGVIDWLLDKGKEDEYDSAHVWYLLGACYLKILGVSKPDHVEVVEYYKLAAEKGHPLAQCALGNCYDDGVGIKQNVQKAISYYELSAVQGFPLAQCNLGMCYEHGDGCEKDMNKAVYYYKLAADQNYAHALYILGDCYSEGIGVDRNLSLGLAFYEQGANQGDLDSLRVAGEAYLMGTHCERNERKGIDFLITAADRHHADSQMLVAKCYRDSLGVERDVIEICRYLRRASKSDDAIISMEAKRALLFFNDEYRLQVMLLLF